MILVYQNIFKILKIIFVFTLFDVLSHIVLTGLGP